MNRRHGSNGPPPGPRPIPPPNPPSAPVGVAETWTSELILAGYQPNGYRLLRDGEAVVWINTRDEVDDEQLAERIVAALAQQPAAVGKECAHCVDGIVPMTFDRLCAHCHGTGIAAQPGGSDNGR